MIDFENLLKNTKVYQTINKDFKSKSLGHCIMIISEDSIAVKNTCRLIARMLLCSEDNCGTCKTCKQVENGIHPSLIIPQALNSEGLKEFIPRCYKSVDTDIKVALIDSFQDIDAREQNKLLKLIEEPSGDMVFIMGVTKISAILDTIKSRATKFVIEPFDENELKEALLTKFDSYNVEKAMAFAEGSIQRVVDIIANPDFISSYSTMLEIMDGMQKSGGLLEMVNKTNLKTKRTLEEKKNALAMYLDALEIIIKQSIEYQTGVNTSVDDIIVSISQKYNTATLVNVEDLVIDALKKADSNCDPDGTFYQLLMSILEVKFKCQS